MKRLCVALLTGRDIPEDEFVIRIDRCEVRPSGEKRIDTTEPTFPAGDDQTCAFEADAVFSDITWTIPIRIARPMMRLATVPLVMSPILDRQAEETRCVGPRPESNLSSAMSEFVRHMRSTPLVIRTGKVPVSLAWLRSAGRMAAARIPQAARIDEEHQNNFLLEIHRFEEIIKMTNRDARTVVGTICASTSTAIVCAPMIDLISIRLAHSESSPSSQMKRGPVSGDSRDETAGASQVPPSFP